MHFSLNLQHKFHTLTNKRTHTVAQCVDSTLFDEILPNILKVRVPDTPGHAEVKEVRIMCKVHKECVKRASLDTVHFGYNVPIYSFRMDCYNLVTSS